MLHTEPSFSIYSTDGSFAEGAENEDLIREKIERSDAIGKTIESQFSFGSQSVRVIEEEYEDGEEKESVMNRLQDLDESGPPDFDLEKDISNPLALNSHAQYLETRGDFSGAEEYHYRATMVNPKDGEILAQCAKFVWEIHGDQAKALNYFKRAVQAAPEDSNVLAAYASFLWRIDDESDEEERWSNTQSKGGKEDPNDGEILCLYANMLWQFHGDKDRAMSHFERAVLATPGDSNMLASYANFLWETETETKTEND